MSRIASGTMPIVHPNNMSFVQVLSDVKKHNSEIIGILKIQKQDDVQELLQSSMKVQALLDRLFKKTSNTPPEHLKNDSVMFGVLEKLSVIVGEYAQLMFELQGKDQLSKQLASTRGRRKFEQLNSSLLTEATILDDLSDEYLQAVDKNYQKLPVFEQSEEKVEILDQDGFNLWVDLVGNETTFMADVSKVVKSLIQKLGVNLSTAERKIILQVLDPSNTGQISSLRWNEFLKGFGPLSRCLMNLQEMLAKPWFHGFLSRDDATKLLEVEPKGTFMVRFSSTKPGSFSLAHTMDNGVVNHVIVHTRATGFAIREDNAREKLFPSVSHLIEAYSSILVRPYSQTFPRELWWHGDLSAEEAENLLQGKKPGTFLIRFSSTQRGCFASSYVEPRNNTIEKGLIIGSPHGYMLSGKLFDSMEQIVESLIGWGIFSEPYKNTTNEVNDKMRFKIVSEIVQTERTYVKQLDTCGVIFIPEFRQNPKISPQETSTIWANMESILAMHKQFLLTLERTVSFWDPEDTAIGTHFLQIRSQLPPLYSLYVNTCQDSIAAVDRLLTTKEGATFIKNIIEKQPNDANKQHQLQSFLILPVQRLPRYILLLSDLIKHTNGAHSDYDDLVDALAAIKEVTVIVNESKRVVEKAEEIKKMQTKIEGLEGESLALLGRSFVKEGKLVPVDADSKDYYVFLFSDLLLLCKKKSSDKYKLRSKIPLNGTQVVSVPDAGNNKNMIRIVGSAELTLLCETPKAKEEWLDVVKGVITKLNPPKTGLDRTTSIRRPSAMPSPS